MRSFMSEATSRLSVILSGHRLAVALLLYFTLLHFAGLYLFTRGFLLSRLALPDISPSAPSTTLTPTHSRAVIIIIDALRFDFVSPDPPSPRSSFHHNVLTLPSELTARDPKRSFLFQSYADPPTTTLQRLKAITTGSLPTFIDVGSNFHSSSITEDSIIHQFEVSPSFPDRAFMGDDTWISIYPDAFTPGLIHPFDSFNVEDLHTVDAGVTHQLIPLLSSQKGGSNNSIQQPFQIIVAHFLGVDHVGHRLGPAHPVMEAKLRQMDTLLRQVVQLLQDDTLLVVLGDHGMDPKGDHGGDSELETATTTWIYSPGPVLSSLPFTLPSDLTPNATFPFASTSHRETQQIDLLPTISLLLGLPIPFNNLGTVIPELFWRPGRQLEQALRLNAEQIWRFLAAYRESSSGSELDQAWGVLSSKWQNTSVVPGMPPSRREDSADVLDMISAYMQFTRLALSTCRSLWAQFDVTLIAMGVITLLFSIAVLGGTYWLLSHQRNTWEIMGRRSVLLAGLGSCVGGAAGYIGGSALRLFVKDLRGIGMADWTLFGSAATSGLFVLSGFVLGSRPNIHGPSHPSFPTILAFLVLLLHAGSFTSNSFILWEDHVAPYLIFTLVLPVIVRSTHAPTTHLRIRLLAFPLLLGICVRSMSVSTVCREEQHPNCHVTFYSSSTVPVSPLLVLLLSIPATYFLPTVIRRFLSISKSDQGLAPWFLEVAFRASLFAGAVYWLIERLESWEGLDPARVPTLKVVRTWLARVLLSTTIVVGYALWYYAPPCVDLQVREADTAIKITEDEQQPRRQLIVIGFANSYGSSYLLFVLVFFAVIFAVTQLTGELVLVLFLIAFLSHLETVDSSRDDLSLRLFVPSASPSSRPPSFSDVAVLALLGHVLFFGTGHQAVLSTIQWKAAFIGFPTLTYPFSPVLVVLNTLGPFVLTAFCVPLLAMWNVSPVPNGRVHVLSDTVKMATGFMLYHAVLAISCATCAAWLRRHLMVWKVFAPRFMLSGATLLIVDLVLLLAVGVGCSVTCGKIKVVFGTVP